MFCPSCRDEFRPGFTECPDCGVQLIPELLEEEEGIEGAGLVEVDRFRTVQDAEQAIGWLEEAGISAFVPDLRRGPLPWTQAPGASLPYPLLVQEDFRESARQVLESARAQIESEDERSRRSIDPPLPNEYAPSAAKYMALVPADGRVLDHLAENLSETEVLALSIGEEALSRPYGPGKWTGKELLVHVSDDERIYTYRALRFARGDATELPGFEEKDYARFSRANDRRLEAILRELAAVRRATIELFDGFDDDAFTRIGVANGHPMSVRAAAYHIAGHELHHANILRAAYP